MSASLENGIVDPRAGELRDSDSYKLKYASYSGWYYTRFGRDLKIIRTGNGLKFQFYDVWKTTIKMHKWKIILDTLRSSVVK